MEDKIARQDAMREYDTPNLIPTIPVPSAILTANHQILILWSISFSQPASDNMSSPPEMVPYLCVVAFLAIDVKTSETKHTGDYLYGYSKQPELSAHPICS